MNIIRKIRETSARKKRIKRYKEIYSNARMNLVIRRLLISNLECSKNEADGYIQSGEWTIWLTNKEVMEELQDERNRFTRA